MKLVKTDEARAGQKAARDVTDLRGNLLFKAGTELTAELLDTCKQRTISHLFIEDVGGDAPRSPVDLQAQKDSLLREIDRTFGGLDGNATMTALKEASKRYLTAKLNK
ncbi:MAG: hypothetical protein JO332_07915 [Planctomycetaceae bacterium]|nr:hypothetical protein [Planctomycetaceae bacterium]